MKRLESIISDLRDSDQTVEVQGALTAAINLRAPLAKAQAGVEVTTREEEGALPTEDEQKKVNEPLAKELDVTDAEIVDAKESTKSKSGFLGLGKSS